MDPSNGNIYNREQAELLGLEPDTLIPLTDDLAEGLKTQRREDLAKALEMEGADLATKLHRARSMRQPAGMPWDK